ncbi:hypothetical protein B0H17DRAFT_1144711 [Mycena rosella]|uniref:Uncharacterized protein n=1 Tax=Mycena rosella TaxID=1033263 RepID=A0AAD7G2M2_MYCRO|nr:hypothetical protein B0H17DRAFT_1144711 [Mycena rosella]
MAIVSLINAVEQITHLVSSQQQPALPAASHPDSSHYICAGLCRCNAEGNLRDCQIIVIVRRSNDKLQLADLLSQLYAYTLFELTLANDKCGRKILRYVKDTLVDEGLIFAEIRLLLLATTALVGGFLIPQALRTTTCARKLILDFYITDWHSDLVREFLRLAGGFTNNGLVDAAGSLFSIHTMRRGEYRIRVIAYRSHPVAGIVLNLGFCDANGVRHPYTELFNEGVLLTMPRHLVIDLDLPSHVKTWRMMRRTLERGFMGNYAYRKSHTCGVALSCPATLQKTSDAAWANLSFPWSSLGKGSAVPKFSQTTIVRHGLL